MIKRSTHRHMNNSRYVMRSYVNVVLLLVLVGMLITLLSGCTVKEKELMYNGVKTPVSDISQALTDQLAEENPDADIWVEVMKGD